MLFRSRQIVQVNEIKTTAQHIDVPARLLAIENVLVDNHAAAFEVTSEGQTNPADSIQHWSARSIKNRARRPRPRSEEHTSELQSRLHLVCRLLLEKKHNRHTRHLHLPGLLCGLPLKPTAPCPRRIRSRPPARARLLCSISPDVKPQYSCSPRGRLS